MKTIELYRVRNCTACGVMSNIILNAVNESGIDVNIKFRNSENYTKEQLDNLNINSYPTTIIKENDKEVARLVGTYPVEYVIGVLEKV